MDTLTKLQKNDIVFLPSLGFARIDWIINKDETPLPDSAHVSAIGSTPGNAMIGAAYPIDWEPCLIVVRAIKKSWENLRSGDAYLTFNNINTALAYAQKVAKGRRYRQIKICAYAPTANSYFVLKFVKI